LSVTKGRLDLEGKDLLLLLFVISLQALGVVEETKSCVLDLLLVNTPSLTEVVEDGSFTVKDLDCTLLGDILESNNTVRDTGRLEDADPTDFRSIVGVGTTACFSINSFDIDNTKRVAWHDTTLIE